MNVKYLVYAILLALGLSALAVGQNEEIGVALRSRHEQGAMSKRTDAALKKVLLEQLSLIESGHENPALIRRLRRELARRGDREERSRIFTAMRSSNLLEQSRALEDAAYIGDHEAVYHLAELLDDPNPGGRVSTVSDDGTVIRSPDYAVLPPRRAAAMKLAELIEKPPVAPVGGEKKFYTEEDVQVWQRWWQANKDKFEAFR